MYDHKVDMSLVIPAEMSAMDAEGLEGRLQLGPIAIVIMKLKPHLISMAERKALSPHTFNSIDCETYRPI